MTASRTLHRFALALVVSSLACGSALANPPEAKADKEKSAMPMDHHAMSDNMHMMPATVDAVDRSTGMVDVTSEGMKLKLHFPPASLADLKAGDKITVHLGFTR